MNVFPENIVPQYPLDIKQQWKTLVTDMESGFSESRRQVWTFPRRSLKLKFSALSQAEIDMLWDFYTQQKGSFVPFYFYYPIKRADGTWGSYTNEYLGRGDGATVTFDLPSKNTSPPTTGIQMAWGDNSQIPSGFTNTDFDTWSGGASAAPDDWVLSTYGGSVAQESVEVHGTTYSVKLTHNGTANNLSIRNATTNPAVFTGKAMKAGCWVKTSVAGKVYIQMFDGVVWSPAGYHSGSGNWEWIESTFTVDSAATNLDVYLVMANTCLNGDVAYYSEVELFRDVANSFKTVNCDMDQAIDGEYGQCLVLMATSGSGQWVESIPSGGMVIGQKYRLGVCVKSGTSGDEAFSIGIGNNAGTAWVSRVQGVSSSAWLYYETIFTATETNSKIIMQKDTATIGTMKFDSLRLYKATDTPLSAYVDDAQRSIYTFSPGAGSGGVDRISFSVDNVPPAGSIITADFAGQLRYRMRFKDDAMTKSMFLYALYNSGLEMIEVRV